MAMIDKPRFPQNLTPAPPASPYGMHSRKIFQKKISKKKLERKPGMVDLWHGQGRSAAA